MIIAGDIGGTKTNLALFEEEEGKYAFSHFMTFPSQKYDLKTILNEFIQSCQPLDRLQKGCFAIAGPVKEGVCRATNLPWLVSEAELAKILDIRTVYLINDLEANAHSLEILSPDSFYQLYPGKGQPKGNRCVVSPGTGLGEAGLYWDGKRHHPFACEGGHCEFGPRNEIQLDFCRYIFQKFGHASYERALSGPGLHNIYTFFRDERGIEEAAWLKEEMEQDDSGKVITQNGLNEKSELCKLTLDFFVSVLGAEASNTVLKFMALGGVYLGGGIPPKIMPKLKEPLFFEGFVDKGRFRELLEEVPIQVILDDKAALKGAAHYCRQQR